MWLPRGHANLFYMSENKLHSRKGKPSGRDKYRQKPKKKVPRKISKRYLQNAAMAYLSRFASSSENLRRIMLRRINKSCAYHGEEPEQYIPLLDEMIERYLESGLLDDKAYARGVAISQRRRGSSRRMITAKLKQKGLTYDQIETALEQANAELMDEFDDNPHGLSAEAMAAMQFARRRRIGPYRRKDRKEYRQKDLAALGRAGFNYETARQVIQWAEGESVAPDDLP